MIVPGLPMSLRWIASRGPIVLLVLCMLLHVGSLARAQDDLADREQQAMQQALAKVAPSVLQIQTVGASELGAGQLGQQTSSALVLSENGYLISSAFNFKQKPSAILVTMPGGSTLPARLVATDHNRELVLLKVDLAPGSRPLSVVEVVPPDSVRVGMWALAVGRMYDADQPNISVGIISAVDRVWGKAVQTDAKISPSNYGGPLVDIHGRVFGILAPLSPHANMGLPGEGWYDSGIGFAVPLSGLDVVLPALKDGKDQFRGLMGVSLEGRDMYSVPPRIAAVHPRGPAQLAGVRADDTIVEINGTSVINQSQMKHVLGPLYAGQELTLAVRRGDQRIEVAVELAEKLIPYAHPFLGILPVRDSVDEGVTVRYVYPDSPAAAVEIQVADRITKLDDDAVTDAASLRKLLTRFIPDEKTTLTIERAGSTLQHEVTFANLPETLPESLPEIEALAPADGELPKTGAFDLKLAEFKNECSVYVPEDYHPLESHGVVIWLQSPGKFDRQVLLDRWKEHCRARNLILLAPRPRNEKSWTSDEVAFIRQAYDSVAKDYSIDDMRVVVHGFEGGGSMAYYVAFSQSDVVRGLAVVQASVPFGVRPPATDPAKRLAIFSSVGRESKLIGRVEKQAEALRVMKYPVTLNKFEGKSRYLFDVELDELVNWIDSLDRI